MCQPAAGGDEGVVRLQGREVRGRVYWGGRKGALGCEGGCTGVVGRVHWGGREGALG